MECTELQACNRNPLQILNGMPQQFSDATNLAVPPLAEFNLQQGPPAFAAKQNDPGGPGQASVKRQASSPLVEHSIRRHTPDPDPVGLGMAIARMGELEG